MAKVLAPNKQYTGISAGVAFANGVGETADTYLLKWFKEKGYEVEGEIEEVETDLPNEVPSDGENSKLDNLTLDELISYAKERGIDIGQSTSPKGILKKILASGKEAE